MQKEAQENGYSLSLSIISHLQQIENKITKTPNSKSETNDHISNLSEPQTDEKTLYNRSIHKQATNSDDSKENTDDKTFHFERLGPTDSHFCDACKGLLADFQQVLNDEQKKKVNKETLYFCKSCFESARVRAEADGCHFTKDMPEVP